MIRFIIALWVIQVVIVVIVFISDTQKPEKDRAYTNKKDLLRDINPITPYKFIYEKAIQPIIDSFKNLK